ncbi:Mannose-6-phosphate isomerase 2 [Bienertia sinuspersici]
MSTEFVDDVSYLTLLPISLIFVVICLFSLLTKKSKAIMAVNGVFWNEEKLQRLKCSVKNYDWGKIGSDSEVYRLYSANSEGNKLDPHKPYAEFWMGTHESGSSHVVKKGKVLANGNNGFVVLNGRCGDLQGDTLKSWIEKNPNVLGQKVVEKWGYELPFLFKVLSVAKTLSIQAHPCKELAEKLHIKDPSVYKDDNHKPEMALAITKFEILCGFVGLEDLQKILKGVPEISQLVGAAVVDQVLNINAEDGEDAVKAALKQLFTLIMSASENVIAEVLLQLISRLKKKDEV